MVLRQEVLANLASLGSVGHHNVTPCFVVLSDPGVVGISRELAHTDLVVEFSQLLVLPEGNQDSC
jgi:hypothetical protein